MKPITPITFLYWMMASVACFGVPPKIGIMLLIALLIWLSVFGHVRAMNPTIAETAMTSARNARNAL